MSQSKFQFLLINLLVLGSAGCTCINTKRSEPTARPLMSIISRELSGPERLVRVPETGLTLADVFAKKAGTPTPTQPDRSVPVVINEALKEDAKLVAELINEAREESATLANAKSMIKSDIAGNYQRMKEKLDKLVNEGSFKFANSLNSEKFIDAFMTDVFEKEQEITLDDFVQSSKLLIATSDTQNTQGTTDGDSQSLVLLRRKNGSEFLFPYASISNTGIGAILLTDGDFVYRDQLVSLVASATADKESTIVITGEQNGNEGILQLGNIDYLNALINRKPDDADVILLTRVNHLGKAQTHFLPFNASSVVTSYRPQDGDIVQFATIDLMPIVLGSRAIHRRQQREALLNEHTSEERTRLKELSKTTLSQRFNSTVRQTNKLPVAKQARAFSIIAGERINAGLDAVGGAIGVR